MRGEDVDWLAGFIIGTVILMSTVLAVAMWVRL